MVIGIYCILGGLFILTGFLFFPAMHKHRGRFLLLASLSLLIGLILFEAASAFLGITRYGEPVQYNYPQDYLEHGLLGWLAILLQLLGLFSPFLIAAWLSRKAINEDKRHA